MIHLKLKIEKVTNVDDAIFVEAKDESDGKAYKLRLPFQRSTMKRAYVGNIPFATTAEDLRAWFAPLKIADVQVIKDRHTGRSRGFAFVEFETADDFEQALRSHNGKEIDGWRVVVNDATEKRGGGR
jgi:cold-inducible RNA-binding protein